MAVVSSQSQKSQLCLSLNRLEADRQFYFLQVCQLSRKRLLIGHDGKVANNCRHIANDDRHIANGDRHIANDDRHTANDDRHIADDDRHIANDDRHRANEINQSLATLAQQE